MQPLLLIHLCIVFLQGSLIYYGIYKSDHFHATAVCSHLLLFFHGPFQNDGFEFALYKEHNHQSEQMGSHHSISTTLKNAALI